MKNSRFAKFIRKNHNIVTEYHTRYYQKAIRHATSPYEIMKILLLNALSAATSNPRVDDVYACLKHFERKTVKLSKTKKFTFKQFAECFINDFNSPQQIELFRNNLIEDKELKQMGPKKANLFLKELVSLARKDVFANFSYEEYERFLEVPIDKVVRKVYSELYNDHDVPNNQIDDAINELAESLFPKSPILFDDVWFWGHFTFVRSEFSSINEALLYCDKNIDRDFIDGNELVAKLGEFFEIVRGF